MLNVISIKETQLLLILAPAEILNPERLKIKGPLSAGD
jgi:hypothetical protein